jgi:two-component system sensor histidine kinase CpxA
MGLSQINPFNSLFGRVFIWFWSALAVILLSAFFLVKQLNNVVEVNAVSEKQANEAQATMQRLGQVAKRGGNINQALRRLGQRNGRQIVAINVKTKKLRFSFPVPLASNAEELRSFVESDSPLLIRLNNMEFVGPYSLNLEQTKYSVYVGRLLMRSERGGMSRSKATIVGLVLAIFLSTLFCFGLVLSITKPLGALRSASNKLAKGDLCTRIEGLESRRDEVGHVAQDFNTMAARLQSLIDNQKQLMANISHELRTPLTRLQLAVALLEDNLLKENHNENATDVKHLLRIENEISKMDEMIGQVLTLAKINTSQQALNLQNMSLQTLLDNLLQDAKFEAEASHKKVSVNSIPDANVYADPPLLVSAIENIIRNAIRFAKSEVHCEFILEDAEHDPKQKKALKTSCVRIVISDDGNGMQAQEIAKVFDPFFRGKHQVQEISKGAGLGLSIAKAAIELHGGTIQAEARGPHSTAESGGKKPAGTASLETSAQEPSPLSGLSVIIRLPIKD